MLWVGLTGGIGTGKSTVSRILRQRNIPVIDADELAREVVAFGTEGHEEVVKAFGSSAIDANGELNRKEIGRQVFSDKNKLQILESIIHPRVRSLSNQRKKELSDRGEKIGFYDVPLLFEKKMEDLFDRIVVVCCDPKIQKKRLIDRDKFSAEEADRRIAAQLPLERKILSAHFTLHNDGTTEDLEKQVVELLEKLKKF